MTPLDCARIAVVALFDAGIEADMIHELDHTTIHRAQVVAAGLEECPLIEAEFPELLTALLDHCEQLAEEERQKGLA